MQVTNVDWFDPGSGSPIIAIATDVAGYWQGVGEDAFGPDYDLACSTTDCVEVLPWRGREILVLGEPKAPTHVQVSEGVVAIFQIIYAATEELINSAVRSWALPESGCVCDLIWRPGAAACALFEASYAVDESELALPIVLPADTVRIQTFEYKPNRETFLIVHALRRVVPLDI